MLITIQSFTRLSEIRDAFNKQFPYLQLNVFMFGLNEEDRFAKQNLATDVNMMLCEMGYIFRAGTINLKGRQKPATFTAYCMEKFGLNLWINEANSGRPLMSDGSTLAEYNQRAMESAWQYRQAA